MELNKNKLTFFIVGGILVVSVILMFLLLSNSNNNARNATTGEISVWFVGETFNSTEFMNSFKELYPAYRNKTVKFEIFPAWEDYTYTLLSALGSGVGPDIFVLNNNEKYPILSSQVVGIPNTLVNPNDFRRKYDRIFSEDLIEIATGDNSMQEFLVGIPVGFETLGVYYNFRYVRDTDLQNLSSLNNAIASLKNRNSGVIPLGIGNGSSVYNSADILTQFFLLNGAKNLSGLKGDAVKEYLSYGDVSGINGFNAKTLELRQQNKTSLDLFSKGEVYMVIGYPSLVNRIKEAGGFSRSFLQVAPFPHNFSGGGNTLANYNYFVINRNTINMDFAQDFMAYISSDTGASKFLELYPYYLPALLSLKETFLHNKVAPDDFNIELGNFYDDTFDLSGFDKGIRSVYDREMSLFLDNTIYQESLFTRLRDSIICRVDKAVRFQNFSRRCE